MKNNNIVYGLGEPTHTPVYSLTISRAAWYSTDGSGINMWEKNGLISITFSRHPPTKNPENMIVDSGWLLVTRKLYFDYLLEMMAKCEKVTIFND